MWVGANESVVGAEGGGDFGVSIIKKRKTDYTRAQRSQGAERPRDTYTVCVCVCLKSKGIDVADNFLPHRRAT